ncbi:hypothetical protein [Yoonia sp.]
MANAPQTQQPQQPGAHTPAPAQTTQTQDIPAQPTSSVIFRDYASI